MEAGERWTLGKPGCFASRWAWLWLGLLGGCVSTRPALDQAMMAGPTGAPDPAPAAVRYEVGCPDLLEISLPGQTVRRAVRPDGRVDLGALGKPRVEGQSLPAVARTIAGLADLSPDQVEVRVKDYRSQKVYLFGQVNGLQRAVDYRGPETVVDLLQRAGGITPGAEPDEVTVVRSHVAVGGRPEVFKVALRDIVMNHDQHTNVRLEPSDQVHIGETGQSKFEKCVPPVVRPLYRQFWGMGGKQGE